MVEEYSGGNSLEDAAADLSTDMDHEREDVTDSSVSSVRGGQVSMSNSAARTVHAQAVNMTESVAGLVRTKSLDVQDCGIGLAVSKESTVAGSGIGLLASSRVKAKELQTVLLVAGRIDGDVKALFTPLTALALGAGFGLITLIAGSLAKRRSNGRQGAEKTLNSENK